MRRLVASFVLILFLFNILGYGGLLMQLRSIASEKFTQRIDSNLHEMGGALTIKIPFASGAYMEPDYMVNTEIERDGDVFRVIKQRQYLDTLYLVCIEDEASSKISEVIQEFVQSFAGDDQDNQNLKSDLTKDYLTTSIGLCQIETGWEKTLEHSHVHIGLVGSYLGAIIHPPAALA